MKPLTITVQQLADLTGAAIIGNPHLLLNGISDLARASPNELSFFTPKTSRALLDKTKAGALFIQQEDIPASKQATYLIVKDPSIAFQLAASEFIQPAKSAFNEGIHSSAVIADDVSIEEDVVIGPHVVIDQGASIGRGTHIGAGCFIGPQVTLGAHCLIHPHVILLERCEIGQRVIIHSGAVIGSDGFGFEMVEGSFKKIPQLGIVLVEDDVEIGANTTIDRARFGTTRIRKGSKLDNLVQIGHNVEIGKNNVIAAQTGIAGSATTGDFVMMGGQAGINGHIEIKSHTRIAALCAVSKSIGPGDFRGNPAMPLQDYNRMAVLLRNIDKFVERIKILEEKIKTSS